MRIGPLATTDLSTDETAVGGTLPIGSGGPAVARGSEAPTRAAAPLRGGLSNWDPQFNRQLASAQQALGFLDQVASRLQGLKSDLSAKLAANQPGDERLNDKLRTFADLWRDRPAATGGSLDGQLRYNGVAEPRQRFTVRGLDLRTLQSGEKETLTFAVAGVGQRLLPVAIEPGLSADELVRRLRQALAPAGIHVAQDENTGALSFDAPASAWPAVRDSLAVRGAGIRFPSGQLNRVRLDAEPEAVRPNEWHTDDTIALRRSLQEVIDALDRVRHAREVLSRILAEARNRIDASTGPEDQDWALAFTTDFEALVRQSGYVAFSEIAPALVSISRNRVLSLLALD